MMLPKGVHSVLFDTIENAVEFAKLHGGWICRSVLGSMVQWFDASKWTQTKIIEATSAYGTREVGTWPMFVETAVPA